MVVVNIGMLSEVCPFCFEVLAWEWGFWSHPDDFDWGVPSYDILNLLG